MRRSMPKVTTLEKQWQHLMLLCECESKFRRDGGHARLLKLVSSEINQLAALMGFSARRIATRDFRAQREGDHIIRIIAD